MPTGDLLPTLSLGSGKHQGDEDNQVIQIQGTSSSSSGRANLFGKGL